jgi:hypothetical protein
VCQFRLHSTHHQNGLYEIKLSHETFDDFIDRGILVRDPYYEHGESYYVPTNKLEEFNDAIIGLIYTP